MRFRADIEGLRGVAIALVVLAHAGVPGFAGGFIGVDVFFVISGFLITSLLATELQSTSVIDYWGFYARRVRRLMPAMLLMLVVVGSLAWAVLPPRLLPLQATTGMLAALWASNLYFAFEKLDYFAAGESNNLYLHTWSLGVEEQFYLVWPLVLGLVWRWKSANAGGRLAVAVASVAVIGFVVAAWAHGRDEVAAYYLMPTRLWELALGGVVALVSRWQFLRVQGHAEWLRGTGLVLLAAGALLIRPGDSHLFAWLLLPVVGTALLLMPQDEPACLVGRLVRLRVLRFLGRVSYALYLWHWPLLSLARILFEGQPLAMAVAVSLALACAWASTALLEEPARKLRWANSRGFVLLGLATSLVLVIGHRAWSSAIQRTMDAERGPLMALLREQTSQPVQYKLDCGRSFKSSELYPCLLVDNPRATREVLLIGDSVGAQWTPALEVVGRRRDWRLTSLTKAGCPMVDARIHYERIGREYFECEAWRKLVVDYIGRQRFDMVIVGSAATYELTPEQWARGTRSFLSRIHRASRTVVLVDPTPKLSFNPIDCLSKLDGDAVKDLHGCSVDMSDVDNQEVLSALKWAVTPFPNVRRVNFNDLVCPQARCWALRNGRLVYRDDVHLGVSFVSGVADRFEKTLLAAADGQPSDVSIQ